MLDNLPRPHHPVCITYYQVFGNEKSLGTKLKKTMFQDSSAGSYAKSYLLMESCSYKAHVPLHMNVLSLEEAENHHLLFLFFAWHYIMQDPAVPLIPQAVNMKLRRGKFLLQTNSQKWFTPHGLQFVTTRLVP